MSFLPSDYEVPSSTGAYMKLEDGENKFRILSSAVIGYEAWKEKKPVRAKTTEELKTKGYDAIDSWGNMQTPKHFWAFVVYNYSSESVEILSITQKSIMGSMQEMLGDEDWKDPKLYDFVITKKGQKMDTVYTVKSKLPKPLDKEIVKEYEEMNINLEALFSGDNPFEKEIGSVSLDDIPDDLME